MDMTMEEVKDFGNSLAEKLPWRKRFGRAILMILAVALCGLAASAISGVLVSLGANARLNGLQIVFDPQITLAYLAVSYFIGHFNDLDKNQQYKLFGFTLLLSFTVNFVQGALLLLILLPVLKKLKLA